VQTRIREAYQYHTAVFHNSPIVVYVIGHLAIGGDEGDGDEIDAWHFFCFNSSLTFDSSEQSRRAVELMPQTLLEQHSTLSTMNGFFGARVTRPLGEQLHVTLAGLSG
jgi:hypothetical protein